MDKLSTFQKALLNSVDQEFSDVPREEELQNIVPISARPSKHQANKILRRSLIAAAVVLVLVGSVFAAVRLSPIPSISKSYYRFPEYNTANDIYSFKFSESIAAENAPDEIEEYVLPSLFVSSKDLKPYSCFFEDEDSVYHPLTDAYEDEQPLDGKVQTAHYEWSTEEYGQITFQQQTAKSITPGQDFLSIQFGSDSLVAVLHNTFTLGEFEILCFSADFSAYEEFADEENPISRFWFWTDGNYLYQLSCGGEVSDEEMEELFHSIAPVEDINVYLGIK